MSKVPAPLTPEKFLRFHAPAAQDVANMTGEVTDLYRDAEGVPHMTLTGWPCPGEWVATFTPLQDLATLRRRAAWAGRRMPVSLSAAPAAPTATTAPAVSTPEPTATPVTAGA